MENFLEHAGEFQINSWKNELEGIVLEKRDFLNHAKGNYLRFKTVLEHMGDFIPSSVDLDHRFVRIGTKADISKEDQTCLKNQLKELCPWRKGPFDFFGIQVDTEWQSWMKWERLISHLPDFKGRRILDIGSSNGYYMFRMAANNP